MKPWLVPLVVASACGQVSDVPYAPNSDGPGPTFTNERVFHCYPGSFSSLQSIDFRNFKFLEFDKDGKPSGGYPLTNGRFQHDEEFGHHAVDFDSVHYLPRLATSKGDSALVLLSWSAVGGSSSSGGDAKVFTLSGRRLCVLQEIDWDTHFQAGQRTESFDESTGTLVIRSAHYVPGDAHCCVSAMDVVTFRWTGNHFVLGAIQTELSEYGKTTGKMLPRNAHR